VASLRQLKNFLLSCSECATSVRQVTASGRLYPWSHSPGSLRPWGHPVRLPAAPHLSLPPFETTSEFAQAVRKWWKPSCPSHNPCWDALLLAGPPRPPPAQSVPPPNTFFLLLLCAGSHATAHHARSQGSPPFSSPMLAEEVRSLRAGAVAGITPLWTRRAAAGPWGVGSAQHIGAAHPAQPS